VEHCRQDKETTMTRKWTALGTLFFIPFAAMAQDGRVGRGGYQLLVDLIPPVVFFGLLFVIFRFSMKKTRPYQQRTMEHMDRMEQKYDRIIELLTKLTEKDNPKQPPPPPSSQSNQ